MKVSGILKLLEADLQDTSFTKEYDNGLKGIPEIVIKGTIGLFGSSLK
jgi:hypothetical protein